VDLGRLIRTSRINILYLPP